MDCLNLCFSYTFLLWDESDFFFLCGSECLQDLGLNVALMVNWRFLHLVVTTGVFLCEPSWILLEPKQNVYACIVRVWEVWKWKEVMIDQFISFVIRPPRYVLFYLNLNFLCFLFHFDFSLYSSSISMSISGICFWKFFHKFLPLW